MPIDNSYAGAPNNAGGSYAGASLVGSGSPAFININPIYNTVPDTRSEFSKGVARGVDNTQAMLYGATGLGADLLGADSVKNWAYGKAQEQFAEAGTSPAAVGEFTDISSPSDLGNWFMGALGEAVPSMAASLVSSGTGALLFRAVATKMATGAARVAIAEEAAKMVALGAAKKEAEAAAVKNFMKTEIVDTLRTKALQTGAYAGGFASGTSLEGGSNWLDDVQKYGMANTSPGKDLFFGALSGAVESGLGPERQLIGAMAKKQAIEEATKTAGKGYLKNAGIGAIKGAASEGGEEGTQQYLSTAATTPSQEWGKTLTSWDTMKSAINAAAAGAAGGVGFGVSSGAIAQRRAGVTMANQPAPEPIPGNTPQLALPPGRTEEEKLAAQRTAHINSVVEGAKSNYTNIDNGIKTLEQQRSQLLDMYMHVQNNVPAGQMQNNQIAQLDTKIAEMSARIVQENNRKTDYTKAVEAEVNKLTKQYDSKLSAMESEDVVPFTGNVQDIAKQGEQANRMAIATYTARSHAESEMQKAADRIKEHQAAVAKHNDAMELARQTEGTITKADTDLVAWHEAQIKDEVNFQNNVAKQYENTLFGMQKLLNTTPGFSGYRLGDSLMALTRDKSKAANDIAAKYGEVGETLASKQEAARKQAEAEQQRKSELDNEFSSMTFDPQAITERSIMAQQMAAARRAAEIEQRKADLRKSTIRDRLQAARNFTINRELARGELPAPLPYSERSTERPQGAPINADVSFNPGVTVTPNEQTTDLSQRVAPNQYQQDVRYAKLRAMAATSRQVQDNAVRVMAGWQMAEQMAAKKAANTKKLTASMSIDKKATENAKTVERVVEWIAPIVNKLSAVKDRITVLHSDDLSKLPQYVQDAYKNNPGLIDIGAGKIYIFADNIYNAEHARKTVIHESVAHFGLRSIMTPAQLTRFLEMVKRDLGSSKVWKEIAERYKDKEDQLTIAEEVVAELSERITFNEGTLAQAKLAFAKFKNFVREVLEGLGLVKVKERVVMDTLQASIFYLSEGKNKAKALKSVMSHEGADNDVRPSLNRFAEWFGESKLVDEQGRPLMLYHGSPEDFHTFKLSKEGALGAGIYVTPLKDYASDYTGKTDRLPMQLYGRSVRPLYVDLNTKTLRDPAVLILEQLGMTRDKAEKMADKIYEEKGYFGKELITRAQKFGYDSIVIKRDGKISEINLFNASQLKSADKNNGNFDPYSKNIYESRNIVSTNEWRKVMESRTTDMYGRSKGFLDRALQKTTWQANNEGVLERDLDQSSFFGGRTLKEFATEGLLNAANEVVQLTRVAKEMGHKITKASNIEAVMRTKPNEAANEKYDFYVKEIGVEPGSFTFRPEEGTLVHLISQLGLEGTIAEKFETAGNILKWLHAKEANEQLAKKQIDVKLIESLKSKIYNEERKLEKDAAKKEAKKQGLGVKAIAKAEADIAEWKKAVEDLLNVREDLSGISTAEAEKNLAPFRNDPTKWEIISKISAKVEKINNHVLDMCVEEGFIEPPVRKMWNDLYKNYVPLKTWETTMNAANPQYAATGKTLSLGNLVISKERTGRADPASNPLLFMIQKFDNVVDAKHNKRIGTSILSFIKATGKLTSKIFTMDDRVELQEFKKAIQELAAKADKLLPNETVTSTIDAVKKLRKNIREWKLDHLKLEAKLGTANTDTAKASIVKKLEMVEKNIQEANDTIEQYKLLRAELEANPEYKSVKQQMKDLAAERRAIYAKRGYKFYHDSDGVIRKRRNRSKFEGDTGSTVVFFDENNNKVRVHVSDQFVLSSLKGTNMAKPGPVLDTMRMVQRWMAQLMTTLSPAFVAVNFARDWATAQIHIRNIAEDIKDLHLEGWAIQKEFNKNLFSTIKSVYDFERTGTMADPALKAQYEKFMELGGYTRMLNLGSLTSAKKTLERGLKRALDPKSSPTEKVYGIVNWMQDASGAVENATRFAAFKTISEALISNGVEPRYAYQRAAGASLDLTVNFTQRGTWGPIIGSLFLFAQASINSTARIAKAMFPASDKNKKWFSTNPKEMKRFPKYAGGLVAFGIVAGMLGRALGGDDDDGIAFYDKLPESSKISNIHIPMPGVKGGFIKGPVTYGYQALFGMGIAIADMLSGRASASDAFKTVTSGILDNFSFIGGGKESLVMSAAPTLIKPIAQVYANKNYFGGTIYPEQKAWEKGVKPDSEKAWANTNPLWKKFAILVNAASGGSKDREGVLSFSPAAAEYIFKQYLGGVGQLMNQSTKIAVNALQGTPGAIDLSDTPIVSRFASRVTNTNTLSELNKAKVEIETQLNEYKRAKESRVSPEEMAKVIQETAKARLLEKSLNRLHTEMADERTKFNKIAARDISNAEEFKYREAYDNKTIMMAKQFLAKAKTAGVVK